MKHISEFNVVKREGKNLVAVCPKCGKEKLYLDTQKHIYKCFHDTCQDEVKGRWYDDDGLGMKRFNDLAIYRSNKTMNHDQLIMNHSFPRAEDVPYEPDDFKEVNGDLLKRLMPLTADENSPVMADRMVQQYLRDQCISVETAIEVGVMCYQRDLQDQLTDRYGANYYIAFVNTVDGRVVNVKLRNIYDKKDQRQWTPSTVKADDDNSDESRLSAPRAPYLVDSINPALVGNIGQVIITEGEKDALALREAGFRHVISVPDGATNDPRKWCATFEEWLAPIEDIVICGDRDHAGRVLRRRLLHIFRGRCRDVILPRERGLKDIADVLKKYGAEKVRSLIGVREEAVVEGPWVEIDTDLQGGVNDFLNGYYDRGYDLGYGLLTNDHMRFTDEGGLVIVTGAPNSGKSDFVQDLLLHIMQSPDRERRVAMCSFEHPDKRKLVGYFMQRLLRTANTETVPAEQRAPHFAFLADRLALLDYGLHTPTANDILADCDGRIASGRRMDALLVDPYACMDLRIAERGTETEAIRQMLNDMRKWAHENHVLVFIVAHPRKLSAVNGSDEMEEINPYSIAGSANWANFADYLFSVKRVFRDGKSLTVVNMMKVRDQDICHTGPMYFVREEWREYVERASEVDCLYDKVTTIAALPSEAPF